MERQIYRLQHLHGNKITLRVVAHDYDCKPESQIVIDSLLQLLWSEFDRNGYKLEITKKAMNDEN